MDDPDLTDPGREWMAGELPAHEYFALVRRSAWTPTARKRAGVWERITMWWRGRRG